MAQQDEETPQPGSGLRIAPVRQDLTIDPGETKTISLFVENLAARSVSFSPFANDFMASDDESGEPRLLLDEGDEAPVNSFKSLVVSMGDAELLPNERKEVEVTLQAPEDASPGGYYGAVRFAPSDEVDEGNVALTATIGSLFLVKVTGDIHEELSVESFDAAKEGETGTLFTSGPIDAITRFNNTGNIHLQPFGKISLQNWRGDTIESVEVNDSEPRDNVLPTSIRKFENSFEHDTWIGRYTIEGNFGYGDGGEPINVSKTFYVIPFHVIGIVFAVILFLIFGLPRLIRLYNRRVIEKAKNK